jgi:ribosomal protein S18 acetylase RimI-like enzyme
MPEEVRITNMGAEHVAAMLDLIGRFLEEQLTMDPAIAVISEWRPPMEKFLNSVIGKPDYYARIMFASNKLVGFALLGVSTEPTLARGRIGYIADLYVIPELRRHGLGEHLLEDALDILKTANADNVQLNVLSGNAPGIAFYEKAGFKTYMRRMKLDLK